jgi:diguanylate cyclase (GGDEF)-like protein
MTRRRHTATSDSERAVKSAAPADDVRLARVSRLLSTFDEWMTKWGAESARWVAFDQFIRGGLHDVVGAEGVRCFRLTVAGTALESLVPARGKLHALIPSHQGVFGNVLENGHALIRSPAEAESRNEPVWCFPVLDGGERRGVISAGRLPEAAASDYALLNLVAEVVSLLWNRLCDSERLAIARETDDRTGVLTRANFFRVADVALSDGYAEREPAVLLAVALEGIRGLDDRGLWEQRDALVTAVGTAIRARLRSDDVVGRFADDRFVALLRRMDLPLARMIADKLMSAIQAVLRDESTEGVTPQVRCCITGPAVGGHSLRELISAALTAISRGRRQGLETIVADLREVGDPATGGVLAGSGSREG